MRSESREAAYVEFVTARQTHLRRVAYAVCGDWERADEILQQALTRVYVAWGRLQREGSEEAFARRQILRADVDARRAPAPDPDRTPLFDALQALPVKQRKAVLLHEWLGLSIEETAEELGMSAGSVRAHCQRAVTELRTVAAQEAP